MFAFFNNYKQQFWLLPDKFWNISVRQIPSHNPRKNIWSKVRKSSKIGQGYKTLISTFAYFLIATAIFFSGRETASIQFPKILSFFGNSWGKLYTKSVTLDIRFCFIFVNWSCTKTLTKNYSLQDFLFFVIFIVVYSPLLGAFPKRKMKT